VRKPWNEADRVGRARHNRREQSVTWSEPAAFGRLFLGVRTYISRAGRPKISRSRPDSFSPVGWAAVGDLVEFSFHRGAEAGRIPMISLGVVARQSSWRSYGWRVNLAVIHTVPRPCAVGNTMVYLHLTRKGQEDAYARSTSRSWSNGPCVTGHAKITQYGKRNFTHLSF
jgi:hypothetical protein